MILCLQMLIAEVGCLSGPMHFPIPFYNIIGTSDESGVASVGSIL